MFITTKAEFVWDKELEKYVEVHTEGFEYEGELALADTEGDIDAPGGVGGTGGADLGGGGGGGPWTGTTDWSYDVWSPGTSEMIGWFDEEGMNMGDLAYGFGLEREDEGMLPDYFDEVWKGREGGYYEQQEIAATDAYTKSIDEAWEGVEGGVGAEKEKTGQSMYEAMEASRERVSQSLFTGAGTRGKDRAMRALSGAYEDTTKGLSKKLSKAESDAFVKQEGILRDTTMKRESEKRDWVGEVYKALGTMQSRGVEQRTKVDLDKYDGHGAGAPSDSWGDSHGDSYRDTSSNQTYKYHDPWGAASDGDWITWEQWQNR